MDAFNNGTVKIAEDVIVKIAQTSACEVEGVAKIYPRLNGSRGIKNNKGVILVAAEDGLDITVQIAVLRNYKIIDVSQKVQEHVAESVNTMTGIDIKSVNVTVTGIAEVK